MTSFHVSVVGPVRQSNQDAVYASDEALGALKNFYMVADGMGGHRGGGYASHYVAERLVELLKMDQRGDAIPAFSDAIRTVNLELFQKASSDDGLRGMGTTLVAASVEEGNLYVANVGDSRLYISGVSGLRQVTRDHSWVEEMVAQGKIERGSELFRQNKNVITRAVGVRDTVTPDFFEIELKAGDRILLCSDGLSNMVSDEEIQSRIRSSRGCREAAGALLEAGLAGGGMDNISIVIIDPEIDDEVE